MAPPTLVEDRRDVSLEEVDSQEPALSKEGNLTEPLDPKEQRKAKNSDIFTVLAAGAALISDGYQNNAQNMINTLFGKRYGLNVYNSLTSTRISNALTVGTILGQVSVGIVCDRIGRKAAIVISTILLTIGAIFATAAVPVDGSSNALFWWLTIARGVTGFGVGAEYPASSASASEAANEKYGQKKRSTIFILCTNVVLSLGGPIAVSFFLVVLTISNYGNTSSPEDLRRLDIVWRLAYG